jgi:hypothetical protein
MEGSAVYRITVRGVPPLDTWDCFGNLEVSLLSRADGETDAVLTGRLADQAELSGVLRALCELHLPILEVRVLTGRDRDGSGE